MRKVFASILLLLSGQGNAAIIDNGDWTTDTESGLDWLDLNITYGMSYQDIEVELITGGMYAGYRRATTSELIEFISQAGVSINTTTSDIGEADAALSLIEKIGGGWTDSFGIVSANGLTVETTIVGRSNIWFSVLHAYPESAAFDQGATYFDPRFNRKNTDFGPDANGGHWLVRSVPTPPALLLFLTGIIGLGVARMRAGVK